MQAPLGFDSAEYIRQQSAHIAQRRRDIGGKLYLEMGGKLFDDNHASRVLPGFTPDNKLAMLAELKDELEILVCVSARDLDRHKMRADLGISYEDDVLRLIDAFREEGFTVNNVVMTQLDDGNLKAREFITKLERLGLAVARHVTIPGYPSNTSLIMSEDGFGRNDWVETTRDLIVVTGPGPGSGKLATCLSQLYLDSQRGITSGYAKFETFPIWNLPLDHPVNLAYEAATADLDDINVIDAYHLRAHGKEATSYNRDIEVFPLLRATLEELYGESPYQSPTDMGVNMVGMCISDDAVVRHAAQQEIIRRYYTALADEHRENLDDTVSERIAVIMRKAQITPADRPIIGIAQNLEASTGQPASAMQLHDGTIITGKTSELLGCSAAMLLNALKHLAGIDPDVHLLQPENIEPIQTLKTQHLGSRNPRLHMDEVLIALSASATADQHADAALAKLKDLRSCDVHTTTLLGSVDEEVFRNLQMRVTSEPKYQRKSLYHKR